MWNLLALKTRMGNVEGSSFRVIHNNDMVEVGVKFLGSFTPSRSATPASRLASGGEHRRAHRLGRMGGQAGVTARA